MGRNTSRISPICEKSDCTSAFVVLKSRFPTNTFDDIVPSLSAGAARGTGCGKENLRKPRALSGKNQGGKKDQPVQKPRFRVYFPWTGSTSDDGPAAARALRAVDSVLAPAVADVQDPALILEVE